MQELRRSSPGASDPCRSDKKGGSQVANWYLGESSTIARMQSSGSYKRKRTYFSSKSISVLVLPDFTITPMRKWVTLIDVLLKCATLKVEPLY